MTTKKGLLGGVVAVVLIIAAFLTLTHRSDTVAPTEVGSSSGQVHNTPEIFSNGLDLGSGNVTFAKGGFINAGSNQASWKNTLGRVAYVLPEYTSIGYDTGTASSSYLFYVATSSAATISNDFSHPAGSIFGIDGSLAATSTIGPRVFMGTTTATGAAIPVPDGAYLVFQVQSRGGAACTGATCETATSTNRGITKFFWRLQGFYRP